MCIWCDNTSSVIKWNSEEVIIPYRNPFDGRIHRYFTDFYMERDENRDIQKYLVEIKPFSQTQKPKIPKRRTKNYIKSLQTYAINQEKWKAAYTYCQKNNMKFTILTENHPIIKY